VEIATGPAELSGDFVAVYEAHYARLVRVLALGGASPHDAQDLAQEAFARTLAHWRRVRRGSNPAGYVYTVAFRLARRRRTVSLVLDDGRRGRGDGGDGDRVDGGGGGGAVAAALERPRGDAGDVAELAAVRSDLMTAILAMPTGRRACALLCLVADMAPRDAGRALGIAESTVRKQLERARAELRSAHGS